MNYCIDCHKEIGNKFKRCNKCQANTNETRLKKSIGIKNTLESRIIKATKKQLDNMAKGRLLNDNTYKGYFSVKFKEDQQILDKVIDYLKDKPLIFTGKDVYNHLISSKSNYISNRLTHNNIQGILLKLGYKSIKSDKQTYGLWTKASYKDSFIYMYVRQIIMNELDISGFQARNLIKIISRNL